jgi:hypothetical protein
VPHGATLDRSQERKRFKTHRAWRAACISIGRPLREEMKMRRLNVLLPLLLWGASSVADADPYRNITLTSIDIVPYHGLEVGARLATFTADGFDNSIVAQGSFRFGIYHRLELEALIPYSRLEPDGGSSISGLGKIGLGLTFSKLTSRYVELGFSGGVLFPSSDADVAFLYGGANGIDFKLKVLVNFPLSAAFEIQGNLGYIVTGEGESPAGPDINPDNMIVYDLALNLLVLDRRLKLILELNGTKQDEVSRLALTPAIRFEIVPAFVVEGYASVAIGDEDDRLYDTMFGIGFTYEFFTGHRHRE